MFRPIATPMERGWVGRVDDHEVVHLAAQTLQHLFTGGGSAREHARYPLAEVELLSPLPSPPSIRVFDGGGSFEFANPAAIGGPGTRVSPSRRQCRRARRRPRRARRPRRGRRRLARRSAAGAGARATEGPGLRDRPRAVVHHPGRGDAGARAPRDGQGRGRSRRARTASTGKPGGASPERTRGSASATSCIAPAAVVADVPPGPVALDVDGLGRLELEVEG